MTDQQMIIGNWVLMAAWSALVHLKDRFMLTAILRTIVTSIVVVLVMLDFGKAPNYYLFAGLFYAVIMLVPILAGSLLFDLVRHYVGTLAYACGLVAVTAAFVSLFGTFIHLDRLFV